MAINPTPVKKPAGLTAKNGFQIGVRKTFPVSIEKAWDTLVSKEGQQVWLGKGIHLNLTPEEHFTSSTGTVGEVRVVEPYSHLRLTWHPGGWEKPSLIQVRVLPTTGKATISFHQEELAGEAERKTMKTRWDKVLSELGKLLGV